tara:strand:+ start:1229 stop:1351 length:123 start_codon:yes stop_codon:yes gene_type:complete
VIGFAEIVSLVLILNQRQTFGEMVNEILCYVIPEPYETGI